MEQEEIFPLVSETGQTIGQATRSLCHNGSFLLHPVVHLHVINKQGDVFLQKRAENKDIQPGKWDTAVGGHMHLEESILEALKREACEELGLDLTQLQPRFLFQYAMTTDREREWVSSYMICYEGPFQLQTEEISEGRFWSQEEIHNHIGTDQFTPNFEIEWQRLQQYIPH